MGGRVCRLARAQDREVLADMRWRLATDDAPITDPAAQAAFIRAFAADAREDVVDWVIEEDGRPIGAMSVVLVGKIAAPGEMHGRWGYLTNSYIRPLARNGGAGSDLLAAITAWAREEGLELLLVWPSERAYAFYQRAGFGRGPDPLVLSLQGVEE